MARIKRNNYTRRFSPSNPFMEGAPIGSSYQETFQWEEAIVIDVVVNDSHQEYDPDGYNVGAVRFRFINSAAVTADTYLDWAFPLDANVTDYPLINEVVLVLPALNRFYYNKAMNTSNRVTAQALFGLNDSLKSRPSDRQRTSEVNRIDDGGAPIKQDEASESDRLGEEFKDLEKVFRLRSNEGDIIYEGRSGHSIRFGSNQLVNQSPTLLLRCGPNPIAEKSVDTEFGLINENVDSDLSSIWMVADMVVPLTFATVDLETHFQSMEEKPTTLEGNQIIINSGRIVLNSKTDRLLVSTFLGTSFTTKDDHTVDADKNYRSFARINREIQTGENYLIKIGADYLLEVAGDKTSTIQGATIHTTVGNHSIIADKIFIGSLSNQSEPLVLGDQLREFIDQFLNIFITNAPAFTLPTIGIGPLSPGVLSQITSLRSQYGTAAKGSAQTQGFLSENNFVTRE